MKPWNFVQIMRRHFWSKKWILVTLGSYCNVIRRPLIISVCGRYTDKLYKIWRRLRFHWNIMKFLCKEQFFANLSVTFCRITIRNQLSNETASPSDNWAQSLQQGEKCKPIFYQTSVSQLQEEKPVPGNIFCRPSLHFFSSQIYCYMLDIASWHVLGDQSVIVPKVHVPNSLEIWIWKPHPNTFCLLLSLLFGFASSYACIAIIMYNQWYHMPSMLCFKYEWNWTQNGLLRCSTVMSHKVQFSRSAVLGKVINSDKLQRLHEG